MHDPDGVLLADTHRIRDAFEAMDDVFYVFDTDDRLVAWNSRFSDVTGYGDDELYGMAPTDFVSEQDHDDVRAYLDRISEAGRDTIQVSLQTSGGKTIPYEFYSDALTNDDGETIGRIGVGRDVTERVESRRELERTNARLKEFASTLAHDLRTPLNLAQARLAIVTDVLDIDDRDVEEHVATIEEAHDRIERIIDDVLELAKTGDLLAEPAPVLLGEVCREAWNAIEHGSARLTVVDSVTVRADRSLLKRMLTNLLRNAVEHGDDGVHVWVGALPEQDGFYVADDGPGIPAEERDAVFDWKHSTKDSGFGVGLQSVKRVCEAHGWPISVTDSQAGGARFEVTGVTTPT